MNKNKVNLKPIFSGLLKFTTKDDFGNLSATLFTLGCNLRCKYCYNIKFIEFNKNKLISNEEVIAFLKKRIGILDSIVICGGEPTIHNENLIEWITYIKELGYRIKLDTNGTNYKLLEQIIDKKLVDFIALDFKGLNKKFNNITNKDLFNKFEKSLKLILKSGIEYDIRTTAHSSLLSFEDLIKMKKYLLKLNCNKWALQKFQNVETLEKLNQDTSNINDWIKIGKEFKEFEIRNN